MHDFLLAKEIMDELKKNALEKNIQKAKAVNIEIGKISMAHDGHVEHEEDINVENLLFGLENLAKNTAFEGAIFDLKKIDSDTWKITGIIV